MNNISVEHNNISFGLDYQNILNSKMNKQQKNTVINALIDNAKDIEKSEQDSFMRTTISYNKQKNEIVSEIKSPFGVSKTINSKINELEKFFNNIKSSIESHKIINDDFVEGINREASNSADLLFIKKQEMLITQNTINVLTKALNKEKSTARKEMLEKMILNVEEKLEKNNIEKAQLESDVKKKTRLVKRLDKILESKNYDEFKKLVFETLNKYKLKNSQKNINYN